MNETRLYFKVIMATIDLAMGIILNAIAFAMVVLAPDGSELLALYPCLAGVLVIVTGVAKIEDGYCRSVHERLFGELKTPPLEQWKGVYRGDNE